MSQIDACNLYCITGTIHQDKVEEFKSAIIKMDDYNTVIEYLNEKYDFCQGKKELSFKNNSKSISLIVDSDRASFTILNNGDFDEEFVIIKR